MKSARTTGICRSLASGLWYPRSEDDLVLSEVRLVPGSRSLGSGSKVPGKVHTIRPSKSTLCPPVEASGSVVDLVDELVLVTGDRMLARGAGRQGLGVADLHSGNPAI